MVFCRLKAASKLLLASLLHAYVTSCSRVFRLCVRVCMCVCLGGRGGGGEVIMFLRGGGVNSGCCRLKAACLYNLRPVECAKYTQA